MCQPLRSTGGNSQSCKTKKDCYVPRRATFARCS
ncbi:unnamed protein product [Gulo gulo]|uniref:Uncharacterized protein n=1 Tax=Gulo gulo TaxID=48420 RepID=A0A9X9M8L2_GULGU|nr:unnamed protein product [Gulo gulo]